MSSHSRHHQKGSLQRDRQPTLLWMLRSEMSGQWVTETGVSGQLSFVYSLFPIRICKNMQMCQETRPGARLHGRESGTTGMHFSDRRAEWHFSPTDSTGVCWILGQAWEKNLFDSKIRLQSSKTTSRVYLTYPRKDPNIKVISLCKSGWVSSTIYHFIRF